ncbi:MAG: adenylate/guanylate cyclase domain-containing protein [Acidimicrobiales bacterium]
MASETTAKLSSFTSATSMATRLPAAVVGVSLVSLLVATFVGVGTGRDLGNDLTDEGLVALRSTAALDIERHITSLERTTSALSSSPQARIAVGEFADAHAELRDTSLDDLESEIEAEIELYRETYLTPLRDAGRRVSIRDIVDEDPAAIYLQNRYAVEVGAAVQPISVDDARDGSRWSEVHDAVHPVYRDIVNRLRLVDLYMIEHDDGYVVYSVRKRPDLGTSLTTGPFSGSVLADVFNEVVNDPEGGTVISDLSFYDPNLLDPVGAVGGPIFDGDTLVGVMVLVYDSPQLTTILTAGQDWDGGGFPPTGDSYLIGFDGRTRTDPRSYLEDPEKHLIDSAAAGFIDERDKQTIVASGTTVLTQRVNDETINAGIEGNTDIEQRESMTGVDSFSTTEAVNLDGVEWWVVSEVSTEQAEGDLDDFVEFLVVGTAIFIVILAFVAVAWASRVVRPVRAISQRLALGSDIGEIDVPERTPLEFQRLAASFESMSAALVDQRAQVAGAREEKLQLLRRMLPPAVAERVASGDVQSLEEVPSASVAVVVVAGLGSMVRMDGGGSDRDVIDRLHAELDDLAERHGVERVKVVGDAFFAACGHNRPYIDHAPRTAAFAAEAVDAVREIGIDSGGDLEASIGIHTGQLTVSVSGGRRLLYDVWGEPVSGAHLLARTARRSEIRVSTDTRDLLPETIQAERVPDPDGRDIWVISTDSETGGS